MRTQPLVRRLSLVVGILMLALGCAHAPEVDTILHEAPRGSVYLERIPERGFKAAHPVAIEEGLIARTLHGVVVTERKTALQTAFSKPSDVTRAFSDEDVKFLAPYLAAALRQAAMDQQVGFKVFSYPSGLSYSSKSGAGVGSSDPLLSNSSLLETTSGHLLAQDRWLYLTVTEYKKRPEQPDTINMANRRLPDQTGQADKELAFEPKEALKPNGKPGFFGGSSDTVFVIDYQQLARMPVGEPPVPVSEKRASEPNVEPGAKEQDIKQIKEDMKKKDAEIENLKKEMEEIRRDMGKPGTKAP
ncbi:MAG TPA: hypothetical protein VJR69_05820 [Nitrospira sp.]|nr:hypothetical protein [Nitrospira sp.]